ncbi:MAG: type IX secretion system membrane protein PorP/SprF [Bacteroidetes bacterium]|nr:MAG: type IX secretion system membrane protein PorP/SprF [Bacteroidota bacterium]
MKAINHHLRDMLKSNTNDSMRKIIFITALFISAFAQSQQDEQMSLYMQNQLYYNPAYAGSRNALSTIAIARFQWVQFDGAPTTQWFSVHAPFLQQTLGAGIHAVNDRIGNRSRTAIFGDLSASIQLNKQNTRLAAGLSGGIDVIGYDFSSVKVNDQNDPYYGSLYSVTKPNMGAGLYCYSDRFFVGLSSPRLFEMEDVLLDSLIDKLNTRHFFFSSGYVFDLNSVFKLKPSALLKYTPKAPLTVDFNLSMLMYDQIWVGLLYRYNEAMGANVIYNIKQTLSIGYTYDFPINGLRTYQYGSHEVFLRYDFMPKKTNYTSPRYF